MIPRTWSRSCRRSLRAASPTCRPAAPHRRPAGSVLKEKHMRSLSGAVVLLCAICAVLGGWGYFRRYGVSRPPIGVFNGKDILLMVLCVILLPLLYLLLPLWLAAGLLLLAASSVCCFTLSPVLRAHWATWVSVLVLLAIYDVVATSLLPLTTEMLRRLASLPLC